MALVIADRVKETTTSTGTGSVALAGAFAGFQTFSATVGDTNTTYYAIVVVGGSDWEVGVGTYSSTGNSLSRDSVFASSNSGSLVDFSAGNKDVFCVAPAERAVVVNGSTVQIPNSATVPIASGGTGASTASAALTNLGLTATAAELNYVDGVTSNVQTQLNAMVEKGGDTMTGALNFGDSVKAQFGAGNDLQIYHDGSNSYVNDQGTGSLILRGTQLILQSAAGENLAYFTSDGSASLYHNNSAKLATSSTGATVTGTLNATTNLTINSANVATQVYADDSALALSIALG